MKGLFQLPKNLLDWRCQEVNLGTFCVKSMLSAIQLWSCLFSWCDAIDKFFIPVADLTWLGKSDSCWTKWWAEEKRRWWLISGCSSFFSLLNPKQLSYNGLILWLCRMRNKGFCAKETSHNGIAPAMWLAKDKSMVLVCGQSYARKSQLYFALSGWEEAEPSRVFIKQAI